MGKVVQTEFERAKCHVLSNQRRSHSCSTVCLVVQYIDPCFAIFSVFVDAVEIVNVILRGALNTERRKYKSMSNFYNNNGSDIRIISWSRPTS